jgi:hypothetical protein
MRLPPWGRKGLGWLNNMNKRLITTEEDYYNWNGQIFNYDPTWPPLPTEYPALAVWYFDTSGSNADCHPDYEYIYRREFDANG